MSFCIFFEKRTQKSAKNRSAKRLNTAILAEKHGKTVFFVQIIQKVTCIACKISNTNKKKKRKNYCNFAQNTVKYISLICDETGGCHPEKWVISVEYVRKTGERKLLHQSRRLHISAMLRGAPAVGVFPDFVRRVLKRAGQCE